MNTAEALCGDALDQMDESNNEPREMTELRSYFPFYERYPDAAYLDTAASALKLKAGIERMSQYLSYEHANVHRGAYGLSAKATEMYEAARQAVKDYFSLGTQYEVVFTGGTTDGVNLVSYAVENTLVKQGDAILTTLLEHHSNFVPWQRLSERVKGQFVVSEITDSAELDVDDYQRKLKEHSPRVVALTAHSNAFGTIGPVKEMVSLAHEQGALVLVDTTQSVVHNTLDMNQCDADFYVFSAHKLYGPTGLGVLIAKRDVLEKLNPFRTGGGMIQHVGVSSTSWAQIPEKFEAGTPPIAEAVSFHATLQQLEFIRQKFKVKEFEQELFDYLLSTLRSLDGVRVIAPEQAGQDSLHSIVSFEVFAGPDKHTVHPHDIASIADTTGVQIRAGHHCCMPAMERLGIPSTTRASLGLYSTKQDVDSLTTAIKKAQTVFQ